MIDALENTVRLKNREIETLKAELKE